MGVSCPVTPEPGLSSFPQGFERDRGFPAPRILAVLSLWQSKKSAQEAAHYISKTWSDAAPVE